MSLKHVEAMIVNPGNPRKTAKLTFLVDSGAIYQWCRKVSSKGLASNGTQTTDRRRYQKDT